MAQRLNRLVNVTLDAQGAGDGVLPSVPPNQVWRVLSLTVRRTGPASSTYNPATAEVYMGDPNNGVVMQGTYSGDLDTTTDLGVLFESEYLTVRWTDGDQDDLYRATMTYVIAE